MEDQLQSLTRQLTDLTETLRNNGASPEGRTTQLSQLTEAADTFARQSKGHVGYIIGIVVAVAQIPALALLSKWGALKHIPREDAISFQALAEKLDAETALIIRVLVGTGILRQVGGDKVTHTALSTALSADRFDSFLQMVLEVQLRSMALMPAYFDHYGRHEPKGQRNTIHAFAAGDPSLTVWEHLNSDEGRMKTFMAAMTCKVASMAGIDVYNFEWVIAVGAAEPERVLVVDVGGGKGHVLEAIWEATRGLDMERCVVEDLPVVVEEAKSVAQGELRKVRFIPTDFHSEQPVEGALLYHIRHCLHDYGDDDCTRILRQIRAAMRPDSRLIIVEHILGDPPSAIAAANDLNMALIGGKERNLEEFRLIVSQAGLEIREVHGEVGGPVSVVECGPV